MALYILVNQNKHILNKKMQWVTYCPANEVFASPHKDVALNQLIELNSANSDLRAAVEECAIDEKGLPILEIAKDPSSQQVA